MDFLKSMLVAAYRILTSPEASFSIKALVAAVFVSPFLFVLGMIWLIARGRTVAARWRQLAAKNGWRSDPHCLLNGKLAGPGSPAWKLSVEGDEGNTELVFRAEGLATGPARLQVIPRAEYDRVLQRGRPRSFLGGLLGIGGPSLEEGIEAPPIGSARFQERLTMLTSDASLAARLITPEAEALWLDWPQEWHAQVPPEELQVMLRGGTFTLTLANRELPMPAVERYVRLGLALVGGLATK